MKIGYIVRLTRKNLMNRKLRSALTIGGMTIGIGSIVFLVSLGFGLQKLVVSQVADVEALTVLDVTTGTSALLTMNNETVNSLKSLDQVLEVSPSINLSGQVKNGTIVTDVVAYGINPQFIALEGVDIVWGENFHAVDKGTIISSTLSDLIGFDSPQDAIGKTIAYELVASQDAEDESDRVKVLEVKITGVIDDFQTVGFLPIEIIQELGFDDYNLMRVKVEDQSQVVSVRASLEELGYQVDSVADTVGQIDKIFLAFQIVMAALGFIAMFVASLGTFNTLTVSLLERMREIGIMKSIGATSKDIYTMFMVESVLIGIVGTTFGLVFGVVIGQILNFVVNVLANRFGGNEVDIFYTPFLFLFILLSGVFLMSVITGFYPARRAAKLNPLDAIRYE